MKKPLVLVASLLVLLGACANVSGSVAEVNGQSINRNDLNDLLDTVAQEVLADPALGPQVGTAPGTISRGVGASVLSVIIQSEILSQRLEQLGVEVPAADVEAALEAGRPSGSPTFDGLLAQLIARQSALDAEGVFDAFDDVEVDMNPRYGRWDPFDLVVLPEEAPGPATS